MLTMSSDEARKQPAIKRELEAVLGADFQLGALVSGDFAALTTPLTLGVERKAWTNLLGSLASGELDDQMGRLVAAYDVPVLLVEGMPIPDAHGQVAGWSGGRTYAYAWIIGSITGWWLRGVMPLCVAGVQATAPAILELYALCGKAKHRDTYAPRKLLPEMRALTLTERVMASFPGVGAKRASLFRGLALKDIANWEEKEWQAVLGKVMGRRVAEAWARTDW